MSVLFWVFVWWFVSAVIVYGTIYAYFYGKYPEQRDTREDIGRAVLVACFAGILGPIGILAIVCLSGFWKYGWRWK